MWGAIGGAAVTGGFNAGMQGWQQDFAKEMMQNRYQWMVKDMNKAGLNPILATGMNPSTASTSMASSGSDIGELVQKGPVARAQTAQATNAAEAAKAQAEFYREQARVQRAMGDVYNSPEGKAAILEKLRTEGTRSWDQELIKQGKKGLEWLMRNDANAKDLKSSPPIEVTPDWNKRDREGRYKD